MIRAALSASQLHRGGRDGRERVDSFKTRRTPLQFWTPKGRRSIQAPVSTPPALNWHDPLVLWTVAGTIAGVVGVGISIYLIFVTKGARRAAREAREAVRSATQQRSLIEELETVNHKADQLGALVQHEQWFAVQERSREILIMCSQVLSRWPDGLSEEKRDDLLMAVDFARSIATTSSANQIDAADRKRLVNTQIRLSTRISSALGEARKLEERTALE